VALLGAFTTQIQAQSHDRVDMVTALQHMRMSSRYRFLSCAYAGVDGDFIMEFGEYLTQLTHLLISRGEDMRILGIFTELLYSFPTLSLFHDEIVRFFDMNGKRFDNADPNSGSSSSGSASKTPDRLMEHDLKFLISAGYLRKGRDTGAADIYWFSHPQVRFLLSKSVFDILG
jgi:hypothetical protein